jgi:hypothetical protein
MPPGINPLLHYILWGERQGLPPSQHFDPIWYRKHYALSDSVCALAHYFAHRRQLPMSPHPTFDVGAYVKSNRDRLPPHRDTYLHYLATGGLVIRHKAA